MTDRVLRIVDVQTGTEVSRAVAADDGTVAYSGGQSAGAAVRNRMRDERETEAEAIDALLRVGWSNGYLMVDLNPPSTTV